MKKIGYFYMYMIDGFEKNTAVKLHEFWLTKYAPIFDEITFIVGIDDVFNNKKVDLAAKFIKNLGISNYKMYTVKNDPYLGEAVLLLHFILPYIILNKDDCNNSCIFFGHLKGITDVVTIGYNTKSILNWISSLYTYSFEFIPEMEEYFSNGASMYGPLKTKFHSTNLPHTSIQNHQFNYPGTFYWINANNIIENMVIPLDNFSLYINRFIAEDFPFFIKEDRVVSHKNIHTIFGEFCDFYLSDDNAWNNFLKIYDTDNNNMLKNLPASI